MVTKFSASPNFIIPNCCWTKQIPPPNNIPIPAPKTEMSSPSIKNTFLIKLPKLPHISNEQYEIEDYFPLEKMIEIAKIQIDTFKVLKDFSIKKDIVKKELSRKC